MNLNIIIIDNAKIIYTVLCNLMLWLRWDVSRVCLYRKFNNTQPSLSLFSASLRRASQKARFYFQFRKKKWSKNWNKNAVIDKWKEKKTLILLFSIYFNFYIYILENWLLVMIHSVLTVFPETSQLIWNANCEWNLRKKKKAKRVLCMTKQVSVW